MGRQVEQVRFRDEPMRVSSRAVVHVVMRLTFSVALALGISVSAAAQQPGADSPSKALEGRWKLELYLETPSARTTPLAGQINGEVAFSNTAWWNPRDRFGRHSLDLQSFFGRSFLRPSNVTPFGPGDTSMVTEISGNVRGDSVSIDFIPRIDHGGVSMWGRFWGDSAKGKWTRRGTDGDGRFVLRRISSEAVSVAAIPDGRPVAVAVAVVPEKPLTKAQLRAKARADAAAKVKADAEARALARAQSQEKAKADALAKRQARDSALAQAAVLAKAKKDSQTEALAAAKATRDSISAAKLATAKAKRDSVAAARVAARSPKPAATPATTTTVAATTPAARTGTAPAATPNAPPPAVASALATSRPATSAPAAPASSQTPVTPASTVPGAAPLRVRAYDIASNTYFSTKYSLHLPDGHWLYGTLKTGSAGEGYGTAVVRPPGTYEVEVTDFMCGDKVWFLKNKIVQKVVVQPGVPTDVTIDVNLATEPARPSLENKTGALCTSPPGAVK